jgi:hypothetical protein
MLVDWIKDCWLKLYAFITGIAHTMQVSNELVRIAIAWAVQCVVYKSQGASNMPGKADGHGKRSR